MQGGWGGDKNKELKWFFFQHKWLFHDEHALMVDKTQHDAQIHFFL